MSRLARVLLVFALPNLALAQSASPLGRAVPGRYIVTYANASLPATAPAGTRILARHPRLGMAVLQAPSAASVAGPNVALVVQDRVVSAQTVVTRPDYDPAYHSQQGWAVRQVGGYGADATNPQRPGPWNVTQGAGVRIAVLDSGVDAAHPDISPNLALNLSEVDKAALPSACDDGSPQDQQGHGTWTAALAAGALGEGTGTVAGVAPQATILNIKVLERLPGAPTAADPTGCSTGQASGLLSWVIQGIEDAVANHADVISMSLGTLVDITTGDGAGLKATFDHATHVAFTAGTVLIAAAGNDGFDLSNQRYVELPAQARDVVAIVAFTNPACAENLAGGAACAAGPVTMPYYSNRGAPLNALAAPGGSYPAGPTADPTEATGWIMSACSNGIPSTVSGVPADTAHSMGCFGLGHLQYVQAMGTSASAPLAAGVAALIRAAHPDWDAPTVVAWMRSTATLTAGLTVPQIDATAAIGPAPAPLDPSGPNPSSAP